MRAQLDSQDVEAIATRVVELLREIKTDEDQSGYLAPEAAAAHLGVSRKRRSRAHHLERTPTRRSRLRPPPKP